MPKGESRKPGAAQVSRDPDRTLLEIALDNYGKFHGFSAFNPEGMYLSGQWEEGPARPEYHTIPSEDGPVGLIADRDGETRRAGTLRRRPEGRM